MPSHCATCCRARVRSSATAPCSRIRENAMQSWKWIARYAAVVAGALALGLGLAELPLFRQATLGTPRVTAGGLVHVLGCTTALIAFWLAAQRTARQLR